MKQHGTPMPTSPPPPSPSERPAPSAEQEVGAASPSLPSWHPKLAKRVKPKQAPIPKDPVTGKFVKGHPGSPTGSRHKVTLAAENLLEGEIEAITRKCIELAKAGDPTALKLVFDRCVPVRKGRPLPKLDREEGEGTVNRLLRAVLEGEITPAEGTDVVNLVESAARVAAVQALAEQREQQLEILRRAQERGQLGSGVMYVPLIEGGVDAWEEVSMHRQADLKSKVKE